MFKVMGMASVELVRAKIFNAVLAAEATKGHLKWKVSDIARTTSVSRPLIYYHFGKTKQAILFECINVLAEEFYGLTPERKKLLNEGEFAESLARTRKMFVKNPALVVFYQKWRMQGDSPIRRALIEIENRYQAKLSKFLPHLSSPEIKTLHALFHGLVSAPFLAADDLEVALSLIAPLFRLG